MPSSPKTNQITKSSLISICIPTYNRPDFLRQALDSSLEQTYHRFEIVVGDDSSDDASELLVSKYIQQYPGKIKYQRNRPSLGQNDNVNDLFWRASGDRLVLLHDDDLLLPNAIDRLASCWDTSPGLAAAFGKQYLIDHDGNILMRQSENLNKGYHRVPENCGRQLRPSVAGIARMFPNDGYMVTADIARRTGYRAWDKVGDACDFDFGLRLCLAASDVWFLDEYLAKYRISELQLSKSAFLSPYSFEILQGSDIPEDAFDARRKALEILAPGGCGRFCKDGAAEESIGRVPIQALYDTK